MKSFLLRIVAALSTCGLALATIETISYTNSIRQFQMPANVTWDASSAVAATGSQLSALAINPGGARFDLWTVKTSSVSGLTSYLLDSSFVGTYVPTSSVVITSQDPYTTIPRTRADRPFYVSVTVTGLLNGATDPEPSKSVKFLRHVQSYGTGGTGIGIDRTQATLYTQSSIATNGTQNLTFTLTQIPGSNRAKVRGEERFSVFSLEDYQAPESQLASKFIQIWPVADGSISGITTNQLFRVAMPTLTITLNDLYPASTTYAQVYMGNPVLGTTGRVVPGSSLVLNESLPVNRVLTISNYDSIINADGRWTMELLTSTPFGIDRLAVVSFDVNRTIEMNATVTTIE